MDECELAIGVDGGGTKTVAWLGTVAGGQVQVLGAGTAGTSNLLAAGFDVATANLLAAIGSAFAAAKLPPTMVQQACFCLAGAGRREEQLRLEAWAKETCVARRLRVVADGEALLAAADLNEGVALIAGTGSLAWGKGRDGKVVRSGGWGYLVDDGGSGYWIGIEALKAVIRAADGRGPATCLTAAVFDHFELVHLEGLKDVVYLQPNSREKIASLAESVFRLSSTCPIAATIVVAAAEQLGQLVRSVCRQLDSQTPDETALPRSLVMGGGLLASQSTLRADITAQLRIWNTKITTSALVSEPVGGALKLAASNWDGEGAFKIA